MATESSASNYSRFRDLFAQTCAPPEYATLSVERKKEERTTNANAHVAIEYKLSVCSYNKIIVIQ